MSLTFGMLIIVVGGIIKRFDENKVDPYFGLALFLQYFY